MPLCVSISHLSIFTLAFASVIFCMMHAFPLVWYAQTGRAVTGLVPNRIRHIRGFWSHVRKLIDCYGFWFRMDDQILISLMRRPDITELQNTDIMLTLHASPHLFYYMLELCVIHHLEMKTDHVILRTSSPRAKKLLIRCIFDLNWSSFFVFLQLNFDNVIMY